MYEYRATVLRVMDGDTVDLEVDLGLETLRRIRCRLAGIDAPELKTAEGQAAREHLVEILADYAARGGGFLLCRTIKDRREKYGRYLVELRPGDQPAFQSASDRMIHDGFARPYDGGAR